MTSTPADVSLHVQCHCRAQTLRVPVERSALPLSAETCHCDDCRTVTGMLAGDFVMLRDALRDDVFDVDAPPRGLRAYNSGSIVWYWCERCGCHLMLSSRRRRESEPDDGSLSVEAATKAGASRHMWFVPSGVVYPLHLADGTRVFERTRHSWVRPGRDQCGLAQYMADDLPRFPTHHHDVVQLTAEQLQSDTCTPDEQLAVQTANAAESLPVGCHCGYVRMRLLRPTARPIVEKLKHVITDPSGQKFMSNICPCHSCRTTNGFEGGVAIIFISFAHVERDDSDAKARPQPVGYDAATQLQGDPAKPATVGLCTYNSSDDVVRRFCPCCGASVFIDFVSHGPNVCDLPLALIRAPVRMTGGAAIAAQLTSLTPRQYRSVATSWSHKRDKLWHLDFCRDRDFARSLNDGWCPGVDCTLTDAQVQERDQYNGELILPSSMS